ncbi:MAG TPA: CcoQ/FixQ family Cbb3-type cytochrome c oxidase assembly chaperone [Rhodospirillaceae bacterium]|nr:CcoQ/FixQ family Cbb3-type cytochrome c oxidase assembly chaperone [Rhodospirillaceae bacterium]|tara:strand:+ start:171 stop:323 length:153 start_codon:yes stop_codon:yes gene_type:complete
MSFLASHAGLIGLVFFFTFFLGMLVWVFRPGSKEYFKKFGKIPLEEKDND